MLLAEVEQVKELARQIAKEEIALAAAALLAAAKAPVAKVAAKPKPVSRKQLKKK